MGQRVFYGWTIVAVCFLIALFGWGLGFYGPGIYLAWLRAQHGWSTSLISSAVTGYYLISATFIIFIGDAMERFGARLVVLVGSIAMGLGVAGLAVISAPWQIYLPFLIMAVGWASMSGAAINTILAPWFVRKRGLAISLALNGASCGGVIVLPCLLWLITSFGFTWGLCMAVAAMIVLLAPSVAFLHADPSVLGLSPDGVPPAATAPAERRPDPVPTPSPWNRATMLRHLNFWTIAIPFALGLTAQVGFLTHQISYLAPRLGTSGAGLAVSLTTIAAVIGRLLTGACIDRLDRRLVSAGNFTLQAVALGAMLVFPGQLCLYLGCVGFGLGVGNLVSLPGLIVQQEFPPEHFGRIVSLIVACNQYTFAFGPGGLGVLRDVTGGYTAALLVCILLQGLAAVVVLFRNQQAPVDFSSIGAATRLP
jgi:MFS family permease